MTTAETAYKAGISAHCDMLGVDTTDKATYLSDAAVDVIELEHLSLIHI